MSEEFRTRIALTLQRKFLKMLQSSKIFRAGGRRRRRQYPVHNFVTVTFFVLMTLDTIRAYRHPTLHPTMRLWRFAHNRSHVTSAQFLLAQIHADPYTSRVLRMCGHLIYYFSRLSLPFGAEIRLSFSTSLSLPSWNLRYFSE